jgi:hypothetical protein
LGIGATIGVDGVGVGLGVGMGIGPSCDRVVATGDVAGFAGAGAVPCTTASGSARTAAGAADSRRVSGVIAADFGRGAGWPTGDARTACAVVPGACQRSSADIGVTIATVTISSIRVNPCCLLLGMSTFPFIHNEPYSGRSQIPATLSAAGY